MDPVQSSQKNLPRDTFLYLLSIVTLIASAVSLGVLLFQLVNIYYPDVLQSPYYFPNDSYRQSMRFALAALVVLFPVFFWTSRVIRKDIVNFPEKRDLRLRKWLLYLTVFVAALVIIGDLVALVNNYLGGDLTARFLLKIASILFIAGSIFYYYYTQLRQPPSGPYKMGLFPKAIAVIVVAAVVFGFYVAGSPQSRRLVRFDERRVGDLQNIQGQLVSYWQSKRSLPASLTLLEDDISGYRAPRDPKTSQPYEYHKDSDLKFRLCANFETSNKNKDNVGDQKAGPYPISVGFYAPENWVHDQGLQCFSRAVDPDLYPPGPRPLLLK